MSRFSLSHPTEPKSKAIYGTDKFLGWWAEILRNDKVIDTYDAISSGDSELAGVLRVLVRHGFFDDLDVHRAHRELPHVDDISEIGDGEDEEADESVRRAAQVIVNLKSAAAD